MVGEGMRGWIKCSLRRECSEEMYRHNPKSWIPSRSYTSLHDKSQEVEGSARRGIGVRFHPIALGALESYEFANPLPLRDTRGTGYISLITFRSCLDKAVKEIVLNWLQLKSNHLHGFNKHSLWYRLSLLLYAVDPTEVLRPT